MSEMMHATVSAWNRREDGSYAAEINGWNLRVKWRPETAAEGRGFLWEARGPNRERLSSHEVHEEIELAMAEAEQCAASAAEADAADASD